MTSKQHAPGWHVVSWSLSDTLLVLGLVRIDFLTSGHIDLASPGRVNARYHFMKPSRVLLSRVRFRDEIITTKIKKVDNNLKDYKILLRNPDASIEVLSEDICWVEW
jgi:hypothetical protein